MPETMQRSTVTDRANCSTPIRKLKVRHSRFCGPAAGNSAANPHSKQDHPAPALPTARDTKRKKTHADTFAAGEGSGMWCGTRGSRHATQTVGPSIRTDRHRPTDLPTHRLGQTCSSAISPSLLTGLLLPPSSSCATSTTCTAAIGGEVTTMNKGAGTWKWCRCFEIFGHGKKNEIRAKTKAANQTKQIEKQKN